MKINILAGDITAFSGDVIVNAANPAMLGGGGVDGAIHRAAGPGLMAACKAVWADHKSATGAGGIIVTGERCPTSHVRPTPAFDLPCKWVFHTAGPIWPDPGEANQPRYIPNDPPSGLPGMQMKLGVRKVHGDAEARSLLRECFKRASTMMLAMDLRSIAFPAISTGAYGCPQETCAKVARKWANDYSDWPLDVTFFIYPELPNLAIWQEVFKGWLR